MNPVVPIEKEDIVLDLSDKTEEIPNYTQHYNNIKVAIQMLPKDWRRRVYYWLRLEFGS